MNVLRPIALLVFLCLVSFATADTLENANGKTKVIQVSPETLSASLNAAQPDDVIELSAGVYKGGITVRCSGTKGAPIHITTAQKGVRIDSSGAEYGVMVVGSWVDISGLATENSKIGILVSNTEHVQLKKCTLANSGKCGVRLLQVKHCVVEECEVSGTLEGSGINVLGAGEDVRIARNVVRGNAIGGVYVDGHPGYDGGGVLTGVVVEENIISGNSPHNGGCAVALVSARNCTVRNNLITENRGHGIGLYAGGLMGGDPENGARDNGIYNNTVVMSRDQSQDSLYLRDWSKGNTVKNNIFVGGRFSVINPEETCLDGMKCDYNVIANYDEMINVGDASEATGEMRDEWTNAGWDAHSTFGVVPTFAAAGDFHLATGSAGIDMGTDLRELVPGDAAGVSRPQGRGYDCGCYENHAVDAPKD